MVKIIIGLSVLFLLGSSGCSYPGKTRTQEFALRERNLDESWKENRLSTFEYLWASIDLALDKSEVRFQQNKSLLARYPKWVPGLHPRPDASLRSSIADAYAKGRVSDSEYEVLIKRANVLLDRWGEQRRILTKERFKLRYPI